MEPGDSPVCVSDIYLNPGQFWFGRRNYRIRTLLGSCVALILWHPEKKIGGMSHIILPTRKVGSDSACNLPGKYADESIELFRKSAKFYRTHLRDFQAKIFGGAHLVSSKTKEIYVPDEEKSILESIPKRFNIGEKNIEFIQEILQNEGISLVSEHTGGNRHRRIYFTVWDGEVWMEN